VMKLPKIRPVMTDADIGAGLFEAKKSIDPTNTGTYCLLLYTWLNMVFGLIQTS
jgi:hypothetical protein